MSIETILCPVDFSESSDAAVDLAVSIAAARGGRLLLFHVDPPPTLINALVPSDRYASLWSEHAAWLEARLSSARARVHAKAEVEALSRLGGGEPAAEIISAASEIGAGLIVMSTHGSAVRRALLGSVAETVAAKAPYPVLLVSDRSWATTPLKRALVCVDFSSLSDSLVGAAKRICAEGAELEFLHVVDEPSIAALEISLGHRPEVLSLLDTLHSEARARLEEFVASLALDSKARQVVIGGPIASTILAHASETGASLIVAGSHEPRGVRQRLLGTVADRLLRAAEVPVLVCPAGASSA